MASDPQDRVVDALVDSTKTIQQMVRRVDSLERKFETLEVTLNTKMGNLETEMGTMNAHLDNLVREAQTTNGLLQAEGTARQKEAERRQKIEDDELQNSRDLAKDNRETLKRIGSELWAMFKVPLGFLVTGVGSWLVYHYFYIPKDADPPPPLQVEVLTPR